MTDVNRKLTVELVGTFFLTFIGAGAIVTTTWTGGQPGLVGIAIAHGLALSIAVSAAMNISGGHINPAVTITMIATGRIKPGMGLAYIIAQCIGSTIAGLLLVFLFNNLGTGTANLTGAAAVAAAKLGTPAFGANLTAGTAVVVEIILTFLLVFAIFGTAVDERAPKVGGFGIGLAITADILMGGPITGAAMNPARTLGPLLAGGSATSSLWSQHWVYWVGPVAGALIAGFLYDALVSSKTKG